jgi:hypothetical protein
MTGVSVRFMATSSALPGPVFTCSDKATHAEGCDSGGPAIVELALVRPETLRHHLSVGLPLSESCGRTLPRVRHTKRVTQFTVRRRMKT